MDKSSGEADTEGWSYGSDFSMLTYPPAPVILWFDLATHWNRSHIPRSVACQ